MAKYLDGTGLTQLWTKAKQTFLTEEGGDARYIKLSNADQFQEKTSRYYSTVDQFPEEAAEGWYTVFTIGDNPPGVAIGMIQAYAHSSMVFIVSKGYQNYSTTAQILNYNGSNNGEYFYVKGVRVCGNKVQCLFNIPSDRTKRVYVWVNVLSTNGNTLPVTSLVLETDENISVAAGPLLGTHGKITSNVVGNITGNANYATSAGAVAWSGVSSKPDTATRWPTWSEVTGKPDSFTPSSHNHNYLSLKVKAQDECVPEAAGTMQPFQVSSSDTGYNDGYIIAWRYNYGNYVSQLYADVDPNYALYYRYRDSQSNWGNWKRIPMGDGTGASGTWGINITGTAGGVDWSNVSNKPGSFTPSSHNHDSTYLKLSGGSMTGTLNLVSVPGYAIKFNNSGSGHIGITYGSLCLKIKNLDGEGNVITNPINLYLGSAEYKVLHSGNYTDYTVKKDGTGASGTWGINITGSAATANSATSASRLSSITLPNGADMNNYTTTGVYGNTGTNDCASFVNGPSGRTNGEMRLEVIGCNNNDTYLFQKYWARGGTTDWQLFIRSKHGSGWTSWSRVAMASEISSTLSWSSITSKPDTATRWPSWSEVTNKPSTFTPSDHTHNYLPLSGGELTSNNFYPLTINGGSEGSGLQLKGPDSKLGIVLFKPSDWGMAMLNFSASKAIGIQDNGTPYYGWSGSKYTLWHAGNFNPSNYSLTSHTHNYLPLSGGTITNGTNWTSIVFSRTGVGTGNVGGVDGAGLYFAHRDIEGHELSMYLKYGSGLKVGGSLVWTAGNDGSGSGLDADKLDGYEASYFNIKTSRTYGSSNVDQLPSGTDGWYNIFAVSDYTDAVALCIIRAYAHSSITFLVSKGYSTTATCQVLQYDQSNNGEYFYVKGVRVTSGGYVQALFNKGSNIYVGINIFSISGEARPNETLTLDASESPTVIAGPVMGVHNKIVSDIVGQATSVPSLSNSEIDNIIV